jgi:hypothetical protein
LRDAMVTMFMAESPDRRLIEPAADLVNETLAGAADEVIGGQEHGKISSLEADARCRFRRSTVRRRR